MSTLVARFALPAATAGYFVGRAAEVAGIRAALAAGESVLVSGEGGVGKTRLVLEALSGLSTPIVVAHCDDLREPLPLGPILDGLRQSGLPVPAQLPPLHDPPADRDRLLRAMSALLTDLAPLIVAVEDLQMADPATAALVTTAPPPGVGFVVTSRTVSSGFSRSFALPPLTREETGELAEALRDGPIPDGYAARLHEHTAGIPFLVEEVVRAEGFDDLAVPALLRDVLLWRIRPLDDRTRDILGAAAVLGAPADPHLLATVIGEPAPVVAEALRTAFEAGLLHEQDGRLHFRHTLARQVVSELLPPVTLRMLHLRCARVLEHQVPRPVARLAHHYRLAGSAADHVRNASAAADLATARGDDATAARFLLDPVRDDRLPRHVRVRLAVKLGRSAVDGVTQADAIPVLRALLDDRRLPPGARGSLGLALGRMLRQQGEARLGYDEIARAVPFLTGHARRARALAILSAPDTVVDRHVSEHRRWCAAAFRAASLSGSVSAAHAVTIARISLEIERGSAGAWASAFDFLDDPAFAADPREHMRACLNWAQGALHIGAFSRAATLLSRARANPAIADYSRLHPVAELTEFALDLEAGRHAGLESRILRFLDRPDRLPLTMLDARLHLARLRGGQGRVAEASEGLRSVIADADRVGAAWPLIPAHAALASLSENASESAFHASRAAELVRQKGLPLWVRRGNSPQRLSLFSKQ